jgi:hypothetical protein
MDELIQWPRIQLVLGGTLRGICTPTWRGLGSAINQEPRRLC